VWAGPSATWGDGQEFSHKTFSPKGQSYMLWIPPRHERILMGVCTYIRTRLYGHDAAVRMGSSRDSASIRLTVHLSHYVACAESVMKNLLYKLSLFAVQAVQQSKDAGPSKSRRQQTFWELLVCRLVSNSLKTLPPNCKKSRQEKLESMLTNNTSIHLPTP
jgi:hypothetical protein